MHTAVSAFTTSESVTYVKVIQCYSEFSICSNVCERSMIFVVNFFALFFYQPSNWSPINGDYVTHCESALAEM